jgi:hypothetical protein
MGPHPAGAARGGVRGGLVAVLRRVTQIPDGNVGWVPAAVRAGLRAARERRPDVVLSSSPPLSAHLAAAVVARRLGLPHVPDFRDFFETQRLFGGLRARVDRRIEDAVFRPIAGFSAATEGLRESVAARTPAPGFVLENGYDEEDFAGPAPVASGFRLVHVGSSYASRRSPAALLGALRDLRSDGLVVPVDFLGAPDPVLAAAVRGAGLSGQVGFAGFGTHAEAVAAMRSAPALLLFVWGREGAIERGILAGKTYEYLASGRPVLVLGPAGGETARAVRATGGGIGREIDDRPGIAAAIRDLSAGRAPAPPDPALLRRHTRRAGAVRLARWLADLVASRP